MGSIAKKFFSRSLMLVLFLSLGCLALPVSPAAQGSPEAVVLELELKEAAHALQQRQREAARASEQAKLQRRVAGEFEMLLVKATAQRATMEQWHKTRSSGFKTRAKEGVHKKRLQCRFCP
jgi:hypothetical protein